MSKRKAIYDPGRTKRILLFLQESFNDYIAARVLFRASLPQQAAILSSTAIEKGVKAAMAVRGNESHGHLKTAHRKFLRSFNRHLYALLDDDFLVLNQKVYALRYTDALPVDFNVVIASREFLAELDHTIATLSSGFSFQQGNRTVETAYAVALRTHDDRLCADNHVLAKIPKAVFTYAEPQVVYEVRNDRLRGLIEITYVTNGRPKEASFLRSACTPGDATGVQYHLAFGHPRQPRRA